MTLSTITLLGNTVMVVVVVVEEEEEEGERVRKERIMWWVEEWTGQRQ